MNEMKAKALEKLMMILDDVLGEDVAGRMKGKAEGAKHEKAEGPKAESVEDVLEEAMGEESPEEHKKMASGGASVIALPEVEPDDIPEPKKEEPKKSQGIGIEVKDVKVAAMPRSGLMRKMHGGKKPA